MAASSRGRLDTVKALVKAGAKPNLANSDGHTALFFARNGRAQIEALATRYAETVGDKAQKDDLEHLASARATHNGILEELVKAGGVPCLFLDAVFRRPSRNSCLIVFLRRGPEAQGQRGPHRRGLRLPPGPEDG